MDTYLDIVNENGEPTGKSALKSDVHTKGYHHNTAHIWLYTNTGQILLQQRSAQKAICPLLWDVSVAGHVDAGETIIQAAIREAKEEIGLDLHEDHLQKIGVFKCFQRYANGMIDNEFHHTFIAELKVHIRSLTPQPTEVEALKLVSCKTFEDLLHKSGTNLHFVPSNLEYYKFVLQSIKEAIKN